MRMCAYPCHKVSHSSQWDRRRCTRPPCLYKQLRFGKGIRDFTVYTTNRTIIENVCLPMSQSVPFQPLGQAQMYCPPCLYKQLLFGKGIRDFTVYTTNRTINENVCLPMSQSVPFQPVGQAQMYPPTMSVQTAALRQGSLRHSSTSVMQVVE